MQPRHEVPSYVGVQLCVQGYAVPKPRSHTYVRKTTSNTSDSINITDITTTVKQVASDSTNDRTNEQTSSDHLNQTSDDDYAKLVGESSEVRSNQIPGSDFKSTNVPVPTTPVTTGQTSLTSHGNRSHPASVSIVEINCKLPNTNLHVS